MTIRTLAPHVQEMSDKMRKNITFDSTTGAGTHEEDIYVKLLPEDLPAETVERVINHNTAFVAAGLHAFSMNSLDSMKANPNLDSTNLNIKMIGKDEVEFNAVRSQQFHNPKDASAPVTKTLVTKVKYTTAPTIDTGELSKVKRMMADLAMEANLAPLKK